MRAGFHRNWPSALFRQMGDQLLSRDSKLTASDLIALARRLHKLIEFTRGP